MATAINSDDEVKCDNCDSYLSFSPVFVKESGKSVCGKCNEEIKQQTFRNLTYEALAKSNRFPCRFKNSGCEDKLKWEEAKQHEVECDYRNYNCFMTDCQWIGNYFNIKQHYEDNHSEFLLHLPCVLQPNINVATDMKYLAVSKDILFIVHLQYSVATSMLSFYVCYLGNNNLAKYFNYNIEISSELGHVNMLKAVQPITELHSAQKENEIELNIHALLLTGLITKYEACKLCLSIKLINSLCIKCNQKLTIKNAVENYSCDNCLIPKSPSTTDKVKCSYCDTLISKDNYFKHIDWMCDSKRRSCSCILYPRSYSQFIHDLEWHVPKENRFNTNSFSFKNGNAIEKNYSAACAFNAIFLVILNFKYSKTCECQIISNLLKDEIKYYKCHFKLSNPKTGYSTPTILMNAELTESYDWIGTVTNSDVKHYSFLHCEFTDKSIKNTYNVSITISKEI